MLAAPGQGEREGWGLVVVVLASPCAWRFGSQMCGLSADVWGQCICRDNWVAYHAGEYSTRYLTVLVAAMVDSSISGCNCDSYRALSSGEGGIEISRASPVTFVLGAV